MSACFESVVEMRHPGDCVTDGKKAKQLLQWLAGSNDSDTCGDIPGAFDLDRCVVPSTIRWRRHLTKRNSPPQIGTNSVTKAALAHAPNLRLCGARVYMAGEHMHSNRNDAAWFHDFCDAGGTLA